MTKERETKQAPNGTITIPTNCGRFYAFQANEDKGANPNEGTSNL